MSHERTYELLERLSNLLRAEERRVGTESGLASVHLHALGYLARANRYSDSVGALAEYLGITKGTASQTVQVLTTRELVAAHRDPADGRRVHLVPTSAGRALLAAARPPPLLARALADLDGPSASVEDALERLLRGVQRAGGARAFGMCRTCRHFQREEAGFRCGLTREPLTAADSELICREQEV